MLHVVTLSKIVMFGARNRWLGQFLSSDATEAVVERDSLLQRTDQEAAFHKMHLP